MVKNINRVVLSGNLTRDPELRRTQLGMAILTVGVACNDSRKNQQTGQWEDIPNFIDCTLFGNRAESVANYLRKGTKVFIEGKLRWSSWEDKQSGQKRSKIEVLIDEIEWNNPQGNGQQGGYQQPQQYQQQPQVQQGYYAPPQPQQYAQPVQQQAPQQYQQPAPQQYQPQPQAAPQPAQQQMQMQQPAADTSVYDDDIPF